MLVPPALASSQTELVKQLNFKLTGWANYFHLGPGIRLLPRVSDGKALLRPRKKDFRLRKPVISDLLDPLPRDPTVLTASRQRAAPEVDHVMAECSDRCRVGRHGVIGEIASDNLRQPNTYLLSAFRYHTSIIWFRS